MEIPKHLDMGLNEKFAHAIYTILVEVCGARSRERDAFVQEMGSFKPTREWRFGGWIGFGGKFWPREFKVTCYSEDITDEYAKIITEANEKLIKLLDLTS